MQIGILGATSEIAKDMILSLSLNDSHTLDLFARRPDIVKSWLMSAGLHERYAAYAFDEFHEKHNYEVIVNFVGAGNPVKTIALGSSIFDITWQYDSLALDYITKHPDCKYIFLSSGAVYGNNFDQPVNEKSNAVIPLNNFQQQDWYSMAKLHAECRHRALQDLSIVDIRIFNYFSHTQDISSRFLITDILRAIKSNEVFVTSSENIVRDYLHPSDFLKLFNAIINGPRVNMALDAYSKAPIDKMTLLKELSDRFSLKFELKNIETGVNATGSKLNYFSKSRIAQKLGYEPTYTSVDCIIEEVEKTNFNFSICN